MRRIRCALAIFVMIAMLTTGCGEEDIPTEVQTWTLTLSFTGVEDLGSGYAYEGWLVLGDTLISTGTFTIDSDGIPSRSKFIVDKSDLWAAPTFLVTIEPSPDEDPAPSKSRYLAGDFSVPGSISKDAGLFVGHPAALGDDFDPLSGSYLLDTPTTAGDPADYASGIWFGIPWAPPGWGQTLTLPSLSKGWLYEAWVVGPTGPMTTGKFDAVGFPDFDGAGPAAGPDEPHPFPGQDFVNPPTSLIGYQVWVTIEPDPDNSPDPFTLRPLVDLEIDDVGLNGLQGMEDRSGSFPTGVASR